MVSEPDAEIAGRVAAVRERIEAAAARAGRRADEVTLVAVTKRQPLARIAAGVAAGLRVLGENYVQETRDKQPELAAQVGEEVAARLRWHLIGPLQRNKAKLAVGLFDAVETVDGARLARELDKRAGAAERELDVLLQVNLSEEPQKAGVAEAELPALLAECATLPHLRVVGLMTLPRLGEAPEHSRPAFARLRALRDTLQADPGGHRLRELSMGMSSDFDVAIEEGATLVRVGTALFGPRAS